MMVLLCIIEISLLEKFQMEATPLANGGDWNSDGGDSIGDGGD